MSWRTLLSQVPPIRPCQGKQAGWGAELGGHAIILPAVLSRCLESAQRTPPPEARPVVSHTELSASKGGALGGGGLSNSERNSFDRTSHFL